MFAINVTLCFVLGCDRKAINCHAIPRASILEALAENRFVYTLNQSFSAVFRHATPAHPLEIVKTGVNQAGVFKGLCSLHDCMAFSPIERSERGREFEILKPLHFRALLLEHSRKRKCLDFFTKLIEYLEKYGLENPFHEALCTYKLAVDLLESSLCGYLGEVPELGHGNTDYYLFVLSKNLHVSSCGIFNYNDNMDYASMIGYNLISYADFSILSLTTFSNGHKILDSFIGLYDLPGGFERLVNEIAFFKGEEPLISPKLWRSLDEDTKMKVRRSLVHPAWREIEAPPTVIKLGREDVMSEIPQEIWQAL